LYKIGQVGKRARVTLRTIRYYEELGLIGPIDFPLSKIRQLFRIRQMAQSGDEASRQMMQLLKNQQREAARKKGQYEKMLNEIQSTMELVSGCSGCKTKPSYEACCTCKIISRKGELPLPLRAIL